MCARVLSQDLECLCDREAVLMQCGELIQHSAITRTLSNTCNVELWWLTIGSYQLGKLPQTPSVYL